VLFGQDARNMSDKNIAGVFLQDPFPQKFKFFGQEIIPFQTEKLLSNRFLGFLKPFATYMAEVS